MRFSVQPQSCCLKILDYFPRQTKMAKEENFNFLQILCYHLEILNQNLQAVVLAIFLLKLWLFLLLKLKFLKQLREIDFNRVCASYLVSRWRLARPINRLDTGASFGVGLALFSIKLPRLPCWFKWNFLLKNGNYPLENCMFVHQVFELLSGSRWTAFFAGELPSRSYFKILLTSFN
jgi:hypothetical protein